MIRTGRDKTLRLVQFSLLTALVVVLQLFCGVLNIGGVTITLSLVPVVIGAALFGAWGGFALGGVLGLVNFIMTFSNPVLEILFTSAPVLYILTCFGKTMLAGAVSGLLYRFFREKNAFLAICLSSVAAPIVNTGVFAAMMLLFFRSAIVEACGADAVGESIVGFVLTAFIGINFLVELSVNVILTPAMERILYVIRHKRIH